MKRLVICCDGTWQKFAQKYPTNVVKLAQAIKPQDAQGISQLVFHDDGIGTENKLYKLFGGAFGWGIDQNILDGYKFLVLNYEAGDEIYLFGFSRGAYTVRSLAGLINQSGLVRSNNFSAMHTAYAFYRNKTIGADSSEAVAFRQQHGERVPIKLLGCWDTVGALGVPDLVPLLPLNKLINQKYEFHNTELSAIIENAAHAVAIDETRKIFDVTPMHKSKHNPQQTLNQTWFPGEHGHVGGGATATGQTQRPASFDLSDAALLWMLDIASHLGLASDPQLIEGGVHCNALMPFERGAKGIFKLGQQIDRAISVPPDQLHASVYERWQQMASYRATPNLQPYQEQLNAGNRAEK